MGVDSINRGIDTFVANLFVIGYPRSGTTALWKMLKQHPDIETPVQNRRELKEIYALQLKRRGERIPETALRSIESTYAVYAASFSGRAKYRIDASPDYIYSDAVRERIREISPNAKVIICLREPLDHIRSLHERSYRRGLVSDKIQAQGTMPDINGVPPSKRIDYANQIAGYITNFSAEQLKVVVLEPFRADNEQEMKDVCAFLNVPNMLFESEITQRRKTAPLGEGYYIEGKTYFRPQVEKISKLIGVDLVSLWNY